MMVRALRFILDGTDIEMAESWLETDGPKLLAIKAEKNPAAYVIDVNDIPLFIPLKDIVDDRGSMASRGKNVELGRRMVGRKKIPLINGSYGSTSRALNGIKKLLGRAARDGETNIYVIGVTSDVFVEMPETTSSSKKSMSAVPKKLKERAEGPQADNNPAAELIGLLCDVQEPPELKNRYLGTALEVELVRKLIVRATEFRPPVLILGNTGTGKEVVARSIHAMCKPPRRLFCPINCGAIPENLFESELFGYRKGAFTGAVSDKTGLWEMAQGGTLFLDEIGELMPQHQSKILRALQEGTIRRVGDTKEIPVRDVRILAATNKDLYCLVKTGQFREDLYYRLRGFLIRTPALREHPQDIPMLASVFWKKITDGDRDPLSDQILAELRDAYLWPGNIRELKLLLSALHALFPSPIKLEVKHLRAVFMQEGQIMQDGNKSRGAGGIDRKKIEAAAHLNRVDEAIKAVEVALKSLPTELKYTDSGVAIQSELYNRLEELDHLCAYPLRFGSEGIFYAVSGIRTKTAFVVGLLGEPAASDIKESKDRLLSDLSHTQAAIAEEIEKLLSVR